MLANVVEILPLAVVPLAVTSPVRVTCVRSTMDCTPVSTLVKSLPLLVLIASSPRLILPVPGTALAVELRFNKIVLDICYYPN